MNHRQGTIIGHDVKDLVFDIGVLVSAPTQVILAELGIRGLLRLAGDRLNGFRPIDGFLRTGNGSETRGAGDLS